MARPGTFEDEFQGGYLDQRFARWLMRPLVGTGATPNMVTLSGLGAGLGSGVAFAVGWNDLAGILFICALLADHADGELARLLERVSPMGHVLDRVVTTVNYVAVMCGIGYALGEAIAGLVAGLALSAVFTLRKSPLWLTYGAARRTAFEWEDLMYGVVAVAWLGGLAEFLGLAAVIAPALLLVVLVNLRLPTRAAEETPEG